MWSPTMKRNVALASLKRPYGIKIKENIFAEIYHPEELEYKKIWAKCKVVKRQFLALKDVTKYLQTFMNSQK